LTPPLLVPPDDVEVEVELSTPLVEPPCPARTLVLIFMLFS
jgi:hypothetical protein